MNQPPPAHLLPEIHQREVPTAFIDAQKARFGERLHMMRTIKRALDSDNIMNPVMIFAWCGVCTRD